MIDLPIGHDRKRGKLLDCARMTREKREFLGRLYIWRECLEKVISCLEVADRAELKFKEKTQLMRIEQPVMANPQTDNSLEAFPNIWECIDISNNQKLLAIICFGRLFKSGRGDVERIADNGSRMEIYRTAMLTHLHSKGISSAEFEDLSLAAQSFRDKIIVHADGCAIQVTHDHQMSSYKSIYGDIHTMNFKLLCITCKIMLEYVTHAVYSLTDELQLQHHSPETPN
jgi:hypothetical protein